MTAVIAAAEDANRRVGHENAGHLSFAHGFMPAVSPLLALPGTFALWDQLAAELPPHFRDLSLRARLDAMPVLPAEADHLPDVSLLRAAAILGFFAHAYQSVETFLPPAGYPESIRAPWRTVRRRLGRPEDDEVLTYIDNIVYNWRVVDPSRPHDALMRVGNLRLLVPTVDTPAERIFYLTQVEILAQSTPIIHAIAAAQNAVLAEDKHALGQALASIAATLRDLGDRSLPNIDPRPAASTFQNPVVWAKSVAPLSVPIRAGLHGPSGTNSPIFATLDVFFGRKRYHTILGQEMLALRRSYPKHWRDFLEAVAAISVLTFVERQADAELSAAWTDALESYAGPTGFLAKHRKKVYGYMEVAFRVGRSVTIGGFAGRSSERVWRRVDQELEAARRERLSPEARTPASQLPRVPIPPARGDDREISLAEVARHNDDASGHWIILSGDVYDVTDYLRAHPGGPAILKLYAGTDATEAFARVHARDEQVARLRVGLRLGHLQTSVPADLARALYVTTAIQNSLRLDLSFQDYPAQSCDSGATPTAYKLQRFVESHQRFFHNDLDTLRDAILAVATNATPTDWPPSSAREVLDVIVRLASRVPHFQASGDHRDHHILSMLQAICADIAENQHVAVARVKAFLLGWLQSRQDGSVGIALGELAGYLRPVRDGEHFRALRAIAQAAPSPASSPLWSDHEIMRLRPHQAAADSRNKNRPEVSKES